MGITQMSPFYLEIRKSGTEQDGRTNRVGVECWNGRRKDRKSGDSAVAKTGKAGVSEKNDGSRSGPEGRLAET